MNSPHFQTVLGGKPLDLSGNQPARRSDEAGFFPGYAWGYGIGYDAVRSKGRRAVPLGRVLSEDMELRELPRRQLITNTRDLNRNFSICSWMVRRHLDYVSTFHFRSKTDVPAVDTQVKNFMAKWSKPEEIDPANRHSLPRLMRMWEMRRVLDGDVLINRLSNGQVQTIEGDRIQTMGGIPFADLGISDPSYVVNGVHVNQMGRALSYMIFKRKPLWTGLQWDRELSANFADMFGYYDRIDQVRGISPLASACNTLRDVYEGFDYALVKAKVSQMFGMIMTRKGSEDVGYLGPEPTPPTDDAETAERGPEEPGPRYKVDLSAGPVMLDLDPGDDAKIIESQTPSTEFQGFTQAMVMVALKALDIPFCFFDESHTNYSGSRLAGVQYYEAAVKIKQHDLRLLLDKLTAWRLGLAIMDGEIILPEGFKFSQLAWEWSHSGMPLYDPLKEISGSVAAVNAAMSSTIREAKKFGLDAFELIDEQATIIAYAKKKGVTLSTAIPTPAMDDPNAQRTKTEEENEKEGQEEEKPANGKQKNNSRSHILWP